MSELYKCWLKHSTSVCPVMLVLKTVIYKSKLLDFQNFASLKLEHYSSDSRLYKQTLINWFFKFFLIVTDCCAKSWNIYDILLQLVVPFTIMKQLHCFACRANIIVINAIKIFHKTSRGFIINIICNTAIRYIQNFFLFTLTNN